MKITPDASLFQALSNFPKVNREAINPAPGQNQDSTQGKAANARVSSEAPSFEAARQAALRQNQGQPRNVQASASSPSLASSSASSGSVAQNSNRAATPYNREAPGISGQKPNFVKLGQIIDISV
jgi:hypothetical protein